MSMSRVAAVAALLGGLVWVAAAALDWDEEPATALYGAGVVLLVLALAAGGYALVATAPIWLRAVVTVATPALGFMVWLTVWDGVAHHLAVLLGGIALLVLGAVALRPGAGAATSRPERPARGGHRAAR
jgi:hypothetical protein